MQRAQERSETIWQFLRGREKARELDRNKSIQYNEKCE